MKVLHVTTSIGEQASGSTYAVLGICRAVAGLDRVDLQLCSCEGRGPLDAAYRSTSHGYWKWPPRLSISPGLHRAVKAKARAVDIVHSHGVWNMSSYYAGRAARKNEKPHILSPHGSLRPGALGTRSSFVKTLAYWLYQRRILGEAACLHATCEAEYRDIRGMRIHSPVAIIPHGVDMPQSRRSAGGSSTRRLLFLGRVTPIKRIDNLLRAWASVQDRFADWELHITGIDDRGHEAEMKTLAGQLGAKRVTFTGPVYGNDKTNAFLEADVFVLPSQSENFGMAVAEALAHGVPAIVTKGAPWQGLEAHECGWWIDVGVEPLEERLCVALAESRETSRARGDSGRKWIERDFSWPMVGRKMLRTYEWLAGVGEVPECVRFD